MRVAAGSLTGTRKRIVDAEEALARRRKVVSELEVRSKAVALQASCEGCACAELVVNAACNRGEDGLSFTLFIQAAESLNLNLPRKLALGLHQLMATIVIQAQWFSGLTAAVVSSSSQAEDDSEKIQSSVTYH